MAIISQVLPCLWGGFVGGIYNTIGGVAQDVSAIAVPTFKQGFALGAMAGMMSKIVYTRTEQIKHTHKEKINDDPLILAASHVAAYALMVMSWHVARYMANEYLDFQISKRTAVVMTIAQVVMGIPAVALWTLTSLPNERDPLDLW